MAPRSVSNSIVLTMRSSVGFPGAEHLYHAQSSLHCSLDLYAVIAILPTDSEDLLRSILESLKQSNLRWDAIARQGLVTFIRLAFRTPITVVRWQVLDAHDLVCLRTVVSLLFPYSLSLSLINVAVELQTLLVVFLPPFWSSSSIFTPFSVTLPQTYKPY